MARRIASALAAVVAAAAALHYLGQLPTNDMAASRVVPAIVLARGLPLYAGPDEGPIIDFMYGPLAAAVFVPAAPTPMSGNVLYVAARRIRPLPISMPAAMKLVKAVGVGSHEALRGADLGDSREG